MTSRPPPDDPEERRFLHGLKGRLRRTKDSVKPPNPSSPTPGRSPTLLFRDRFLPRSRPTTPTPSTGILVSDSDEQAPSPTPRPPDGVKLDPSTTAKINKGRGKLVPPVNVAVGALIGCLDVVQTITSDRDDCEQLADELASMVDALNQHAGELGSESSSGSIANISQSISNEVAGIHQQRERRTLGRLLDAMDGQDGVVMRYQRIEKLFQQLQCHVTLRISSSIQRQMETTLLRGMLPVDDARYNSSYSTTIKRHGCTAETRQKIHEDLQDWATSPTSAKVYWMSGMAGTGKTTIAYSFCEWLEHSNRLGASFFCSRISSACKSINRIIPTLAYQFARYSPAFASTLCAVLKDNPDAGTLNVVQQFEHLVHRPSLKAKDAIPDDVVIVIDALDECDDNYSVRMLLDILLKLAGQLSLRFFMASRPEFVIRDRMMTREGAARSIMHLHDIEQSIVEEDIKKYLTDALSSMSRPPSSKQIETLAKRAGKLFIYAATLVRYIHPRVVPVNSSARLEAMLRVTGEGEAEGKPGPAAPPPPNNNKYKDLDRLYATVLETAFNEELGNYESKGIQSVLWTIVCAREPTAAATVALLVELSEAEVWSALQSLRSVLHVPEGNGLVSTLHASFPEYMLDRSRSKEFCCNASQSNEMLAQRCFEVMKSELRFNICNLPSSYHTDDQVEDIEIRVSQCISPVLSYACRYWGSHLLLAPALDLTFDILEEFLSDRLLFWMEVLSLKRCSGVGVPMLNHVQAWLRKAGNSKSHVSKQIADARNFITWFAANPCSRSTPHIYISALSLCAKSNWVYQHYSKRTHGLANIVSQRDDAVLAIWSTEAPVDSVAISPEGDRIAAGTADGSIHIYDIHTGSILVGPFKGHISYVLSVTFSSDGAWIASGSADETAIVWDAQTGSIITGPLRVHISWVWSVAFSPDGSHIVSGGGDNNIYVWDTLAGTVIVGPLHGHTGIVMSVAFAPDGRLIASSSADKTVRLWDANTGRIVTAPLEGHEDRVTRVAFSPNGDRIASSSSDKTIRVWDVQTGALVGNPFRGHKGGIWSMAFSSDGSYIVSGEEPDGNNVMVWNVRTNSVVAGPLQGHMGQVRSVAISSDNARILSGSSDQTIRIWDVQTKAQAGGPLNTRTVSVGPIALSPDHTQFVSSSSNGVLRTWDLSTSDPISPPFKKRADAQLITSISIDPRGYRVAASTDDFTIRVWNADTGELASQPLSGHKDAIRCLIFSPNNTQLCSGSDDSTIIVWDIQAGAIVGQPYYAHTGSVRSVMYSPDGKYIASSGTDHTVRLWEPTGTLVRTLSGHRASVDSVIFSPGADQIVSGSADGSIRKWEVETGDCSGSIFGSQNTDSGSSLFTNRVCFSTNGTHIISGFGSSIRIVDAQTMKLVAELDLPWHGDIHWVKVTADNTNIISVSISQKTASQQTHEPFAQQSLQTPNIFRVWRVGNYLGRQDIDTSNEDWSYEPDGRVLSPDGLIIWVSPDLIPYLKNMSVSYRNPLVLSSDGFINLGYEDACIGDRWTECYIHQDS